MSITKTLTLTMLLAVLLSACGPAPTPTMSPEEVLATANSVASTMVAQTQAAIPTPTPIPPTETPSPTQPPTNTPLPQATSAIATQPPTQAAGGEDTCIRPLNIAEAGPTHPTVVRNQTGGSVNVSLNLYNPNAFGQCGAISLSLGKNGSQTLGLPAGDWWAYAWVTFQGGDTSTASGSFFVQPAQFDKLELCVREEVIVYKPSC
jgi:hypothetical protein